MRAYLFFLLLCPIVLFGQEQPVNGSTDCPTFGKKNTSNKAGIFQYMRTHKPQRKDVREQPIVYKTSALPDLKKAQEDRDAETKRNNQTATARRQGPVKAPETKKEAVIVQQAAPPEETAEATPEKKEEKVAETKESKDEAATADDTKENVANEAKEKRDKKIKKAARKAKIKHIFKSDKQRTSRKNVQKCPSF
ncbi:MAG TPA: hypothetical protein VFF27_15190 [Bacteroidia bacterium]|jgi:hypothetical protein|nr:hypothetical protein [Bacteroidia bacterium]